MFLATFTFVLRLVHWAMVTFVLRTHLATITFVARLVHRPTIVFVGRFHRATFCLRLRLATLMFTTMLTIHRRTAKAFMSPLLTFVIVSSGGIHGSTILWRIHRSTLPIALRLRAIALTSHFWTAFRLPHIVRAGSIAFPTLVRARLVTPRRGGRRVCFGRCWKRLNSSWRLICGLGFLGL
ncbi:MAG: hypothetical protein K9N47_02095 [Prosthecobacter sp.]|uniref:hypothetical protein n=1 Tax=Prosthecobacter sp. TaxID=1965333 RepID=UPI0025D6C43C|nr:hypothetical protein [Prosthecobacter sp.]MCF7784879.1 hypothetical protein [Prosthecobacter sp.]